MSRSGTKLGGDSGSDVADDVEKCEGFGGGVGRFLTPTEGNPTEGDPTVLSAPETVARRPRSAGGGGGGRRRSCGDGRAPSEEREALRMAGGQDREGESEVEEVSSESKSIRFPSGTTGELLGLAVSLASASSPTSIGRLFLDLFFGTGAARVSSLSPAPSWGPRLPAPRRRRDSAACGAEIVFLRAGLVRGEGGGGGSRGRRSCW